MLCLNNAHLDFDCNTCTPARSCLGMSFLVKGIKQ